MKFFLISLLLQLIYSCENFKAPGQTPCRPLYRPIRRFKAIALDRQLKEVKNRDEKVPQRFIFDLTFVQHDSFLYAMEKHNDSDPKYLGGLLFYAATQDVIDYYLDFAKPGELLCYTKKNKTREWSSLNEAEDHNLKIEALESTYSGPDELYQFEYQDVCVEKEIDFSRKTSRILLGCSVSLKSRRFELPPPIFGGLYFQMIEEIEASTKGIEFLADNLPFPEELSHIKRKPFQLFNVPNDGACLYHSLAKSYNDLHFNQPEITKDDVLKAVVDQLHEWKNQSNADFKYKKFGNCAANGEMDFFEEYHDALKRDPQEFYDYEDSKNWGDEELIPVFGRLYETNVFVFQAGSPSKATILNQSAFMIDDTFPWIFIFNASGLHFDALLPHSEL